MHYLPLWPEPLKPPRLSIGVAVYYYEGEEAELAHLLRFLEAHFELTKKDFGKTIKQPQKRLPRAWDEEGDIPMKLPIYNRDDVATEGIGNWIGIGFYDRHQGVFQAYKQHLDRDNAPDLEKTKNFFAEVEKVVFGTKDKLH